MSWDDDLDLETLAAAPDADATLQRLLVEAAQNGNDARIHHILESDAAKGHVDVNRRDAAGSTPIIYAACYGHEAAVAELLRDGAEQNAQDQTGWTPLMWAVNNNHVGIVRSLLAGGADFQVHTEAGRSAADFAMPGSAVHAYLVDSGYISTSPADELYHRPEDPEEADALFAAKLEESTKTLGLVAPPTPSGASETVDMGLINAGLGGSLASGGMANDIVGATFSADGDVFDWDTFYVRHSFAIQPEDIPAYLNLVISEFRPTLERTQVPVSANCLFLAARYLHYTQGDVLLIMSPAARRIKLVVEEEHTNLALISYWLANVEILLYYLNRDYGMRTATADIQNTFSELVEFVRGAVIADTERRLLPKLQPSLLDYESIPGIGDVEYRDGWNLFSRHRKPPATNDEAVAAQGILPPTDAALRKPAPRDITQVLSSIQLLLEMYHVHPITTAEIYAQLFYWISATLFNMTMDNRRYLARSRAMQIRLNVSALEDWCRSNDFRPEAVDDSVTYGYKSLMEIARGHLAPLTQILQWLQCFSGFGADFTTVVAAMQELTALNPLELQYAAKKYRVETNEPVLSREYRAYLGELAAHYEATLAVPDSSANISKDAQPSIRLCCIDVKYSEPRTQKVEMDLFLQLPTRLPSLKEGIQVWGGGYGSSERQQLVPTAPAEIVDALDDARYKVAVTSAAPPIVNAEDEDELELEDSSKFDSYNRHGSESRLGNDAMSHTWSVDEPTALDPVLDPSPWS